MADEKKPITQTSMPAQPPTVSLPAMTDRALLEDLTRVVKTGFADVRIMRGDLDLLVGDVSSLKVDVRDLQRWKLDTDERQNKHSGGLTRVSTNDEKQDATIGLIKATVDEHTATLASVKANQEAAALERAKTAALTETIASAVSGFWKSHPALGQGLATLIGAAITFAIVWLQRHS